MAKHLLAVHDDDIVLDWVRDNLEKKRWSVTTAQTQEELNNALDSGRQIDLALVDVRLGQGFDQDGFEIANDLRQRGGPGRHDFGICPRASS